jgi:hypothetical protein
MALGDLAECLMSQTAVPPGGRGAAADSINLEVDNVSHQLASNEQVNPGFRRKFDA